MDVTTYCGTWQRFAKVVLSPCGDIAYRWMTILDAVPPEGSEITVVQLRLAPLSFTHWNSSRFLESFNYVMHCWRWNIQISSYLSWGTLFLNISIIFSRICWQTGDPRPIFAPKGLDLSWMLLLYQIIITITCWHQLFQITSLFNQFTSLLALNCSCPNFFWNLLQVWMAGKDVYLQMTWSWPDKTWNIVCSYCLQWNTSQSKFRNHYFLFFICVSILSQLFLIWGCTLVNYFLVRSSPFTVTHSRLHVFCARAARTPKWNCLIDSFYRLYLLSTIYRS